MAFDYDEFQQDIGVLIKHYDLQDADGDNLDADRAAIFTEFEDLATLDDLVISGLASSFDNWERQYEGRKAELAGYALRRMQDPVTVLNEIGATSGNQDEVLKKLIEFYALNSKSVNASVVTLGSVSAGGANLGNGTVLTTKILDGYTSPGRLGSVFYPSHPRYKGVNSELCVPTSETITVRCVADSFADGLSEGSERFTVSGRPSKQQHSIDTEGSGELDPVICAHAATILTGLDFESFSSNTPTGWTVSAGTPGTHILQESVEIYHGSSSLEFVGVTAFAGPNIYQSVTTAQVKANKAYCLTARVKADASVLAGTLTIQFEGTGYSAGSTEKIEIAFGDLPTSWTLYSFFVNMPAVIPSDFKLVIKWTGTPTNAKHLYIDDLSFSEVNYRAGFGLVVPRGSSPWARNDYATFAVSATEGVVQRFFRRAFGVQMPSDNAAGETWADSTAT